MNAMSKLARNAAGLEELRSSGFKPDLPVLVSFVGDLRHTNTTLYAEPSVEYNWRCIAGLDVEVIVNRSVPFDAILSVLRDLAACVPARMVLTYTEGPRLDLGEWRVIDDFALFDWLPMSVGPTSYMEAELIRKRINAELGKSIPLPYEQAIPLFLKAQKEIANGANDS